MVQLLLCECHVGRGSPARVSALEAALTLVGSGDWSTLPQPDGSPAYLGPRLAGFAYWVAASSDNVRLNIE